MSRSPIENFPSSNGHGRAQAGFRPVSRQSNLLVESSSPVPEQELRQKLIEECKKQGKPFGLLFQDYGNYGKARWFGNFGPLDENQLDFIINQLIALRSGEINNTYIPFDPLDGNPSTMAPREVLEELKNLDIDEEDMIDLESRATGQLSDVRRSSRRIIHACGHPRSPRGTGARGRTGRRGGGP